MIACLVLEADSTNLDVFLKLGFITNNRFLSDILTDQILLLGYLKANFDCFYITLWSFKGRPADMPVGYIRTISHTVIALILQLFSPSGIPDKPDLLLHDTIQKTHRERSEVRSKLRVDQAVRAEFVQLPSCLNWFLSNP